MDIPSWPRPHYVIGGGNAFILYAAYGSIDISVTIDRQHYRCQGMPIGFQLLSYDRYDQSIGFQHYFKTGGWKPAALEHPQLAKVAEEAKQLIVLRGYAIDPPSLDYLRDCIGIVQYLFDRGAKAVFDPNMLQLWSPESWRPVFDLPHHDPHQHVVILRTPEEFRGGRTEWIHTRGLRKYGRPDMCVRGVGPAYVDKVIELLNRYIEYQALGGTIEEGDVVTLDGLPPDGTCFPDSRLDHPDFHNAHVEIRWPGEGLL